MVREISEIAIDPPSAGDRTDNADAENTEEDCPAVWSKPPLQLKHYPERQAPEKAHVAELHKHSLIELFQFSAETFAGRTEELLGDRPAGGAA